MKKLWAPWRLEYILEAKKSKSFKNKKSSCVFCDVQNGSPSVKNLVLYKGDKIFVVMNKFPYNNGHLMVMPKRHIRDFSKLKPEEHAEIGHLMDQSMQILKKVYRPQGFNLGLNVGMAGGAGIREHLHYHVVPRWNGDNNFMPVVGDVRVMVEHLRKSYSKIKKEFAKL